MAALVIGFALPFDEGVNPAWRAALATLAEKAVAPLLGAGKATLTEKDWLDLKAKLAAHRAWVAEKPATVVEKLGAERLDALLAGDVEKNLELAKERAKAVREALKAAGVAEDRINMKPPVSITGSGDNAEARRVELNPGS